MRVQPSASTAERRRQGLEGACQAEATCACEAVRPHPNDVGVAHGSQQVGLANEVHYCGAVDGAQVACIAKEGWPRLTVVQKIACPTQRWGTCSQWLTVGRGAGWRLLAASGGIAARCCPISLAFVKQPAHFRQRKWRGLGTCRGEGQGSWLHVSFRQARQATAAPWVVFHCLPWEPFPCAVLMLAARYYAVRFALT